jgi:hypothetical protein
MVEADRPGRENLARRMGAAGSQKDCSVLRQVNSLAVVDDTLGFLEPESNVHPLRNGVFEIGIRRAFGTAGFSCPLLYGFAELTGHSLPSPTRLYVNSFKECDRRRRAAVDVIATKRCFCKPYRPELPGFSEEDDRPTRMLKKCLNLGTAFTLRTVGPEQMSQRNPVVEQLWSEFDNLEGAPLVHLPGSVQVCSEKGSRWADERNLYSTISGGAARRYQAHRNHRH